MKELLEEFYLTRLKHYEKRKEYLLSKIQRDVEILTMKEKFILEVIDETIKIRN
jgi:DNA topoisomerase-2